MINKSQLLTVQVLDPPFALIVFRDDAKVKRCSIWVKVLILRCNYDRVKWNAHGIYFSGQGGTVIVKVLHLNRNGSSGCL